MRLTIVVALLVGGVATAQGRDLSKVEVKTHPVKGSVFMLEGAGGNIGVQVGKDGLLIIDDQFAPLAPKIEAALAKLGKAPLRFVLNTHWHGDHTGGNAHFGEKGTIIAHRNVRLRLEQGLKSRDIAPAPVGALPVITYGDGIAVHLNGEEIRVVQLGPAHTDGDSIILFEGSNVAHLGDQFFNGRFPYVDHESGGSVRGLIANLEKVRKMLRPDVRIIPGHGDLASLKDLEAYLAMIKDCVARVQKGIKAGKSLARLKKEKVLKGYEPWGAGFITADRFIEHIYEELKGPK